MSCTLGKEHVCCTRIEGLTVKTQAGNFILNDINLHLHCGELTAIVGKNGSGKSTFMKALLNVIPHNGKIIFESEKCVQDCAKDHTTDHDRFCSCHTKKSISTTKPKFGYVPQSLSVQKGSPVSVEDFIRSTFSKKPVWIKASKKEKEQIIEILKSTNAHELISRRMCDLSGGELQRVLLAAAINPVPDILLLDEPVSGVDRIGLKTFYELVSSLRRDYDVTILLISHDLDIIKKHADRVVFLHDAKASIGTADEIYNSNEFIQIMGIQNNSQENESGEE